MFWEFGIVSSEIEDILDKECDSTLECLLDEPDLLQEINSKNVRLIDYCSRDEIINRIFSYVITEPDPSIEECNRYKYPMLCSEILSAGIASFDNLLINDSSYLLRLFEAFNQTDLNILVCNFMVKILVYLVTEYPEKFHEFVVANNIEIVDILLKHIEFGSICDAILKLQSHELTTDMRAIYIELLYEQNIIGKLYSLITYDTPNEIKSAACNMFIEIIRIHRIRPTLFLDNFKYTENMILVEQAQSNNLLKLLLDNMFAFTSSFNIIIANTKNDNINKNVNTIKTDSDSSGEKSCDKDYEEWLNIGRTINYGCIMLMSLFDSTRISDSYGDEFNEFGYIRNTVLSVIATDFILLSSYIKKFVYFLHLNLTTTVNTSVAVSSSNPEEEGDSSSSNYLAIVIPFGTTNVNVVRLLCILTIFQCECIEKALIDNEFFVLLWRFLPYFNRNNAFHSLLFDSTSFILLSDLYIHAPIYLAQNSFPKESVLGHLKMRYDFANPSYSLPLSNMPKSSTVGDRNTSNNNNNTNTNGFTFGNSTLLYNYLINDIQILLIIMKMYEMCCYTVNCDFRGHLMQLVTQFSKLPSITLIPTNPELTIVPSFITANRNECEETLNCDNPLSRADLVKQKWEFFCNTIVSQYIKNNEIDPNVFTANTFHEDHLDNLFRSFDSNFTPNHDEQNGSFSFNNNDCDALALQTNVKLEGINYMESMKHSLLFGADNVKFPNRFINGSKNAFICSSDDEDGDNDFTESDAIVSDDRVPKLYSSDKNTPSSPIHFANIGSDHSREFAADIQGEVVRGDAEEQHFEKSHVDSSARLIENSKLQKNKPTVNKSDMIDDRMMNPYDNSFEFGEKNTNYVHAVINDRVSRRLECRSGTNVFSSENSSPSLSSNSLCDDHSSPSHFTCIDVDHRSTIHDKEEQKVGDNLFSQKSPDQLLHPRQTGLKSATYYSDSEVFYSLPSVSEIGSSEIDTDRVVAGAHSSDAATTSFNREYNSFSDNIFHPNSDFKKENIEVSDQDQESIDRKGTSSPLKLSISCNSDEMFKNDVEEGVFCSVPQDNKDSSSKKNKGDTSDDCNFYIYDCFLMTPLSVN